MQGVGGLESIMEDGHLSAVGVVQDYFGNVLGAITEGSLAWNPTRFSSYGPVPGYQSPALSPEIGLALSLGWRGERVDETGLICLGARHYDPVAGRFLNADPLGHSASMDLYSFCGGDPVNNFDPDGRLSKGFYQGLQLGSSPDNASGAFSLGYGLGIANDLSQFFNSLGQPGQPAQQSQPSSPEHIWDIGSGEYAAYYNQMADQRNGQLVQQDIAAEESVMNHTFLATLNALNNGINQASNPNLDPLERWGGGLSAFGNTILGLLPFAGAAESTTASVLEDTAGSISTEGATAGSIRNVNPTSGTMNCVNCAIASDTTLAGNAASALPGGPTSIGVLENTYGGAFQPVSGQMQIGSIVSQSGNGARGIVFGESMSGDVGHVFNVLNNNGSIQFLDGQIGGSGLGNFNNFQNFQFLLTHPGTP
jgi:RHS repeat-associated protein